MGGGDQTSRAGGQTPAHGTVGCHCTGQVRILGVAILYPSRRRLNSPFSLLPPSWCVRFRSNSMGCSESLTLRRSTSTRTHTPPIPDIIDGSSRRKAATQLSPRGSPRLLRGEQGCPTFVVRLDGSVQSSRLEGLRKALVSTKITRSGGRVRISFTWGDFWDCGGKRK